MKSLNVLKLVEGVSNLLRIKSTQEEQGWYLLTWSIKYDGLVQDRERPVGSAVLIRITTVSQIPEQARREKVLTQLYLGTNL